MFGMIKSQQSDFFLPRTHAIMLILPTVMSFTCTRVYVNSPWANVVYKIYQR